MPAMNTDTTITKPYRIRVSRAFERGRYRTTYITHHAGCPNAPQDDKALAHTPLGTMAPCCR